MNTPKILILDVETAPLEGNMWRIWKENIGIEQIRREWYMLCWAAKWAGSDEIMSDWLPNYPTRYKEDPEDDATILTGLWDLFDEADIIVAHNGDNFDIPKCKTRFLLHGWLPPSPSKSIDTLKIAKKIFGFTSNKLDFIAQELGVGKKVEHEGFRLWKRCLEGHPASWKKMVEYNEQDVLILEGVYDKLVPWSGSIPNAALFGLDIDVVGDMPRCGVCVSSHMQRRGFYRSNSLVYRKYQCQSCGKWMRGRMNILSIEQRQQILTNAI